MKKEMEKKRSMIEKCNNSRTLLKDQTYDSWAQKKCKVKGQKT
jgi:hypothetical protein